MNAVLCPCCSYPVFGEICGNPACRCGVNATPENVKRWDEEAERRKNAEDERAFLRRVRGW